MDLFIELIRNSYLNFIKLFLTNHILLQSFKMERRPITAVFDYNIHRFQAVS